MFLFKRSNGIWYIGNKKSGKPVSCRTRSKTEANLKLADEINKQKMELSGEIDLDTFQTKVIKDAAGSNFSSNSIDSIKNAFKQLRVILSDYKLSNPLISSIKTIHIQDLKEKRTSEVSPASFNIELRTLKGIFARAVRWGYLLTNPCKGISCAMETEQEILCMNPGELKQFFDAVLSSDHKVIFMTALHTICRRGELINIRIKNVSLDENRIRIINEATFRTKTKKIREVPVSPELNKILREYINKKYSSSGNIMPLASPDDYLFTTPEGNKYTEDALSQVFRRIRRRAKLPEKYHLHCLRHTGISLMLNELNIAPTIVKEIAGHARLTTTMKYCHVNFEQKKQAIANVNYSQFIK
jgi:integrase